MSIPTTEPVEELILQDIEAALLTIRTDAAVDYWNDVYYVERKNAGAFDFPAYPAIAVVPVGTSVDEDVSKNEHSLETHRLNLSIDCYLDTRSNVARAMLRLMRDVRTALRQDPKRGGLAIHTYINDTRTYFSNDTNNPISTVEIDASVLFRTNSTALESAL